jgi:ATP-dependent Lhr-like helicase
MRGRSVRVVQVDTPKASPFAQSLLFNWIAAYMYEGDAPLAERRAAALSLDRDLLRDLLGAEDLRELLDPGVLADLELELQALADGRRARSADELHDVLRRVGDLDRSEIDLRCEGDDASAWVHQLERDRRAVTVLIGGAERIIAADDAGRYRDAFGCAVPLGLPREFTEPVQRSLESVLTRYARTHGPFTLDDVVARFVITRERAAGALGALEADQRVVRGEFRQFAAGTEREWCDSEVLRLIRRRSLAVLRREVEPVDTAAYSRFLHQWHGVGEVARRQGVDALVETIAQLQGVALIASSIDSEVLPARVRGYRPADLDALFASGDVVWVGAGGLGANDGRVRLFFADQLPLLAPAYEPQERPDSGLHDAIRSTLRQRGASFWTGLRAAAPDVSDDELLGALWDLVWSGEVTNDSFAPVRTMLTSRGLGNRGAAAKPVALRARPRPGRLHRAGPPLGAGRWSLVEAYLTGTATPTETAHAMALQLLERHGVVTREAVLAEGVVGGYASVYGVLKVLEERGHARRGYFVSGLGAAQFAVPGAVDRLRAEREPGQQSSLVVLAATDPAQAYGSTLAWPDTAGRPTRTASALVVLADGVPLVWFDRRAHHLVLMAGALDEHRWASALAELAGTNRTVEVRKVDGEPLVPAHPAHAILVAAGFVDGYRGVVARRR